VNVTEVPAQIAPDGTAAMVTLAGNSGLTVIFIAPLVAGLPVAQVAFEVIFTVMALPLVNVVEV
jgi:hypothetical protein